MNSSRYILTRIAMSFGIGNKNRRLSDAADELHLLRQAEEILGEDTWQEVEEVEEISVDYWNLRKHQLAIDKLTEQINDADSVLDASQEARDSLLSHSNQINQAIESSRDGLLRESESLMAQRDEIVANAQRVKRRFEASRMKVSVLTTQDTEMQHSENQAAISEERNKLAKYKQDLIDLKKQRDDVVLQINEINEAISKVETELNADRKRLREKASSAYQDMGKANRDKSKLRAEVGLIEDAMKEHFTVIGRYVSMNMNVDDTCTKICKEHSTLIAQMQSLRSSIALNHKLAAFSA